MKDNLKSLKITAEDITEYGIQGIAEDVVYGADNVKKLFDRLVEYCVAVRLNSLIEILSRANGTDSLPSGAEVIGCQPISGLLPNEGADNSWKSGSIREFLIALNKKIDETSIDGVPDGGVTSVKLSEGAVTTAKIADGAVTYDKITDRAISASKLQANSVTTEKIADNAVTEAKLSEGLQEAISKIGDPISMDDSPTLDSQNPVTSDGLYRKFQEFIGELNELSARHDSELLSRDTTLTELKSALTELKSAHDKDVSELTDATRLDKATLQEIKNKTDTLLSFAYTTELIAKEKLSQAIRDSLAKADSAYQKPQSGVPLSDLAESIKKSLAKADSALQSFAETDPTVPAWAKASTKPTYTAQEVGALPNTTKIPSQISELTNNAGFWAGEMSLSGTTLTISSK